ncbi:ribosomal protein L7/L12 [Streptomyces sp. NBC_01408]|uniref:ribosomal protein L7/L12 n=1 Tax=Streptomyces sp. NBC_01408 TaxID=2903855 RepID=UPI002255CF47|nr:ribosomal protein L7/L12 [Streptomyces sp. NBC_01408]MCX4692497.1 ribosomal protein L7/L12 [Streptomyces sp. NBC_01408]
MTTLFLLLALIATAGWITSTVSLRMKALETRADRLERRLGLVLEHFGIEEPEHPVTDDVRALLRDGRKIEAIKVYRQSTGAGLAEAKQAVEAIAVTEAV